MKIEIKYWMTGSVLFEGDFSCLSDAVKAAIKANANLRYANLRYANWAVLSSAPREVQGLRLALVEGRVNGSTYEGECACLVGTIANVRHVNHRELGALVPESGRPAEKFFLCINKGDTPDKNQAAKLAVEWLDEWYALISAAFTAKAE